MRPALTTVAVPTYELGATAMRLMLRRLGEEVPDPPGTVTTRAPAGALSTPGTVITLRTAGTLSTPGTLGTLSTLSTLPPTRAPEPFIGASRPFVTSGLRPGMASDI